MKKAFKKFNLNSTISNVTAMALAGAGSAGVDWLLKKYDVIPGSWDDTIVNAVKVAGGAILASMVDGKTLYGIPKAVGDGVATVGAYNLMLGFLPDATTEPASEIDPVTGLPKGMIGASARRHLGQRGFARKVNGVNGTPAALMSK